MSAAAWPWAPPPDSEQEHLTVTGGRPLTGRVRVPGDKSVSHRALMLAARAEGVSTLRGLSCGDDVRRTALALLATGATITADGPAPGVVRVEGGVGRLHEPEGPIDVGNSGTGIRQVARFPNAEYIAAPAGGQRP